MSTTVDFLNEALDAVVTVLAASSIFMSTGTGTVKTVARKALSLPRLTKIQQSLLPYAGVVHDEDKPLEEESSLGETEIALNVGVWLYDRGGDSEALEVKLLKARAALLRIVDTEVRRAEPFGGKAGNAHYLGGPTADVDEEDQRSFGLLSVARIQLWVPRPPT